VSQSVRFSDDFEFELRVVESSLQDRLIHELRGYPYDVL
jgi:hypothetical protein